MTMVLSMVTIFSYTIYCVSWDMCVHMLLVSQADPIPEKSGYFNEVGTLSSVVLYTHINKE